jgi:hypothetical protein
MTVKIVYLWRFGDGDSVTDCLFILLVPECLVPWPASLCAARYGIEVDAANRWLPVVLLIPEEEGVPGAA